MRALLIVMCLAAPAAADVGFAWNAPATCPSVSSIEARVEQRLGRSLDPEMSIQIAVTLRDGHYVARLELGSDVRSLTSDRCDELSDAIAIVIARVADERRLAPPVRVAVIEAASSVVPLVVHRDLAVPNNAHPWSLGVRLSGVSGIGSMDGTGNDVSSSQRWFAAGAGFGVAWPITPWLRAVGATELLMAIERVKFEEPNGVILYAPSPMSARATLGIEVGWE